MKGIRSIISIVVCVLLFFILNNLFLTPLGFSFAGMGWLLFFLGIVGTLIVWNYDYSMEYDEASDNVSGFIFLALTIICLLVLIIKGMSGGAMFHADEYRAMLGEVQEKTFSNEIDAIDITQIPTVNEELARRVADKKLGEQVALGSQAKIDEGTFCNVNGKLIWVFPLVHTGLFKYMDNKMGTPGYITVSATDAGDVEMVNKLNGKDIFIQYQPQAFGSRDLSRYVYENYSKTVGYTDKTFELDDDGQPYWTITTYKQTIGYGGEVVTGLLTVHAMTGELKWYAVNEVPEWVDRVYPKTFLEEQLSDWGRYVNGWGNLSKKGILKASPGTGFLYNKGECYFYTGLTSSGGDEASVGFILCNTKTHETTFYKVSGATEYAGLESIEGAVQEQEYVGDYPYLINVEGIPTYFTPLKDKSGLIKKYGFCSVKNYEIVGVGATIKEAKANYVKNLKNKGNTLVIDKSNGYTVFEGTIDRIGLAISDGTSYYNIVLKEIPDKIFVGSQSLSGELPFTQAGDKVKFEYNLSESFMIDLMDFDNLMFTQTKSEAQQEVEEQAEQLETEQQDELTESENQSLMEQELTPEQEAELNEALKDIIDND